MIVWFGGLINILLIAQTKSHAHDKSSEQRLPIVFCSERSIITTLFNLKIPPTHMYHTQYNVDVCLFLEARISLQPYPNTIRYGFDENFQNVLFDKSNT